ncbi:hypothetical protein NLJ89_g7804 [Agrocybe chaxingu]|uniref:Uncharacterized protein n=1 Tax=Agrocybe chaxingu TaxID=84603 RepID=A0A9W8JYJ2_9AGAR|nr:hypothetical protein NLJ89_g7804 [Agrocybe chaxingu]
MPLSTTKPRCLYLPPSTPAERGLIPARGPPTHPSEDSEPMFGSDLPLEARYRTHPHFVRQIYGAIITTKFTKRFAEKLTGRPEGSIKNYFEADAILSQLLPLKGLVHVRVQWYDRKTGKPWSELCPETFVPIIPMNENWYRADVGAERGEGETALTESDVEKRMDLQTKGMMGLEDLLDFRWFNLYEIEAGADVNGDPDAIWKYLFLDEE